VCVFMRLQKREYVFACFSAFVFDKEGLYVFVRVCVKHRIGLFVCLFICVCVCVRERMCVFILRVMCMSLFELLAQ